MSAVDGEGARARGVCGSDEGCHPRSSGHTLLRRHLARLRASPTEALLLDGGTGEELFLRGVPDDRKIWSATAIVHEQYHSIVEDVHKSFIEAGSQAVTTNSYGITPGVGFTDGEDVKRLTSKAGEIARRSVTKANSSDPAALVLGSLGPQVESYRPDLIMKHDDGVLAYRHPIEGLYPHVDAYLAETMSCLEESRQAVDALSKFYDGLNGESLKHPMLVSFTLRSDGKIRSGESVGEVIPNLIEYAHGKKVELVGVLFNCCEPEAISKALKEIRSNQNVHRYLEHHSHPSHSSQIMEDGPPKIFLGAYANRLTPVEPQWTLESSDGAQEMRKDLLPEQYWEEFVRLWHKSNSGSSLCETNGGDEQGENDVRELEDVQLIGGCCGIGPAHISLLRERLAGVQK